MGFYDAIYSYEFLLFVFQDTLGNDLVKGIGYDWHEEGDTSFEGIGGEVKRDLYTLDAVYPKRCMDPYAYYREPWPQGVIYDEFVPKLGVRIFEKNWALGYSPLSANECSRANWIALKLKCPYVFGDETEQEIVTYWKGEKLTRITFNGIEKPFEREHLGDNVYGTRTTIILDDN